MSSEQTSAPSTAGSASMRGARRAIVSEEVDLALCGGLSIAVFIPLLLLGFPGADPLEPFHVASGRLGADLLVWTAALNFPHFFASYWLVYRSKETRLLHKWASIYLPCLVAVVCGMGVFLSASGITGFGVGLIAFASGCYLAWHYTGQTFGMMSTFSIIERTPFTADERRWFRASLNILLSWHVAWGFDLTSGLGAVHDAVHAVFPLLTSAIGLSFAVGSVGFGKMYRRIGRIPAARIFVPWLAIHCWYALMARYPFCIVLVQLAHAIQYLPFTARLELNRARADAASPRPYVIGAVVCFVLAIPIFFGIPHLQGRFSYWVGAAPVSAMGLSVVLLGAAFVVRRHAVPVRMLSLGVVALVGGCALFWFSVVFVSQTLGWLLSLPPAAAATARMIPAFLAIHHYFTDGVLWKLSNPQVRRDLFAHLEP